MGLHHRDVRWWCFHFLAVVLSIMQFYWILDEDKNTVPLDSSDESRRLVEEWLCSMDKRQVACTRIGELTVSTVFLVIAHPSFGSDDTPMLFETMTFNSEGGEQAEIEDGFCRYQTWNEAVAGHNLIVESIAKQIGEIPVDITGQSPFGDENESQRRNTESDLGEE